MESATIVANTVIKLRSIGVLAVRHYAPTEDHHTSKLPQGHRSPQNANIKLNFLLGRVP